MGVEFLLESGMVFNGEFDLIQAQASVPAVFTLSHDGELGLDVPRTRDFYKEALMRFGKEPQWTHEWQHCVLVDNATRWPQYALVTGKELVGIHPRFCIEVLPSYDIACDRVVALKRAIFEQDVERASLK